MSNIWDDYQKTVDEDALQKDIKEARKNTFEDLPKGKYHVEMNKLEMKMSKTGKPMVSVSMKVIDGEHKGRLMFMNRVIGGTKNDARMIAGIETWLSKLEAEDDSGELIDVKFKDYPQFADLVMDIAEALGDMGLQYDVDYDDKAFNSIDILGVLE